MKQLIIGLLGEGPTDYRFLNSIIRKTFEEIAFECTGDIEILEVQDIKIAKAPFTDYVFKASKFASEHLGIMILCVHTDADARQDQEAFNNRIDPALKKIAAYPKEDICKRILPIVPIRMSESWMLADENLFREEICTTLSFKDLKITQAPENIADPKAVIKEAIRIAYEGKSKRRPPSIGELYLPIGQKVKISSLKKLYSYKKFYEKARNILIEMNYLMA